jgi:hypothetical protein
MLLGAKTNLQGEFYVPQRDAVLAAMHGELKKADDLSSLVEQKAARHRLPIRISFALWQNAELDLPILKQAKIEYSKLK